MLNNIEIEIYVDEKGETDLFDDMSNNDQSKFIKKNEDFQKFTLPQLLRANHVRSIKGRVNKGFFEIRYLFTSPPYRAISIIHKNLLVILVLFKGSGSGGKLEKHIKKAKTRADYWKLRN